MASPTHDVRRSPYYVKPRKEAARKDPGAARKKRAWPRIKQEIFEIVRVLAAPHAMEVSWPDLIVRNGPQLIVNGKRCRIYYITKPLVLGGRNAYMRGSVTRESLPLTDHYIFICAAEGTPTETYVIPSEHLHELLFDSSHAADKTVVAYLPHPHKAKSKFNRYRNAWTLLA